MKKHVTWWIILFMAFFATSSSCASTCKRIAAERKAFQEKQVVEAAPHISVAIPLTTINRTLEKTSASLPSMRLALPSLGLLGTKLSLGNVDAKVQKITLAPAREGYIGLQIVIWFTRDRRPVVAIHAATEIKPQIRPKTGVIQISLQPKDIATLRPYLPQQEQQRFADFMYANLPPAVRSFVSRGQLASLTTSLSQDLLAGSWPRIRDELLSDIGPLAQFEIELPDLLPVEHIKVHSQANDFMLYVYTGLAARGLPTLSRVRSTPANLSQVRITGEVAAALVNQAMLQGKIPARYNLQGQPDPNGMFEASVDWIAGPKPLKLHAWSLKQDCAHIIFAGTPHLQARNGQVIVHVNDAAIEQSSGTARVRAGIWFSGLARKTFQWTQATAGTFRFEILGSTMQTTVMTAAVDQQEIVFGLTL